MYLDFFKLLQLPFRLTADPRFHYESAERIEAKRRLVAALGERAPGDRASADGDGCILVSGDAGVGKTIMVHDVLGHLPAQYLVIRIPQPEISVAEFQEAITAELDKDAPTPRAAGATPNLEGCLANHAAAGRIVVLALDNCEVLADELLDELLHLPRRSGVTKRSLRVILCARSSLESTLRKPQFGDGERLLRLHIKLVPLTAAETRKYVERRLQVAGRVGAAIFSDDALVEIQRFTGGVPRLINTLADAALMAAFNRNHETVTAFEIRGATKQLQWVEFDARAGSGELPAAAVEQSLIGHVRIEHQGTMVAEFDLPIGKISLGRAANNDVRIDSRFISRNHCRIVTTAQYSVIEDLQSQNGLIVTSRRVSVHRLHHGDRVHIGEHLLTYTRAPVLGLPTPESFPVTVPAESSADTSQTGIVSMPSGLRNIKPKGD